MARSWFRRSPIAIMPIVMEGEELAQVVFVYGDDTETTICIHCREVEGVYDDFIDRKRKRIRDAKVKLSTTIELVFQDAEYTRSAYRDQECGVTVFSITRMCNIPVREPRGYIKWIAKALKDIIEGKKTWQEVKEKLERTS